MIGTTLGRYRITAKLGEGGMGSVWRAEDPALGRTVALKLLSPALLRDEAARERFFREARAAAGFVHSGIATVYDVGETDSVVWFAQQFVDGETVAARTERGPIPIIEAVALAREIAAALAHAHAHKVLHRDVTAGNVMVTRDGHAVLVDFGLARPEQAMQLTSTGALVGTAGYVAPEILRGERADERSDLYGLGVALYRMLTGRLPFEGGPPESLVYRVLNEPAPPVSDLRPEAPFALEKVVARLLERNPADRFRSAAELEEALAELVPGRSPTPGDQRRRALSRRARKLAEGVRRVGRVRIGMTALASVALIAAALWGAARLGWLPGTHPGPPVLAVLPFENTSPDPEEAAYLSEGLGDELALKLGQASGYRVLPWTTTRSIAKPPPELRLVAKRLLADDLLVGTFRVDGERVRVIASLVDGRSGIQRWSRSFDELQSDLMTVQASIATDVASQLKGALDPDERRDLSRHASANPEAYAVYLQGVNYLYAQGYATRSLALPFFDRAIKLDPDLAEAYAGRGAALLDLFFRGTGEGLSSVRQAKQDFSKALALDPNLTRAQRGLVTVAWESGRPEEGLAVAANASKRGDSDVEGLLVRAWACHYFDYPNEAIQLSERILQLDPSNQEVAWLLPLSLEWSGQHARSLNAAKAFVRRFGEDPEILYWAGVAAVGLGDDTQSITFLDRSLELFGDEDSEVYGPVYTAAFYYSRGNLRRARALSEHWSGILESRVRAQPDNYRTLSSLIGFHGLLGDTLAVRREVEEYCRLMVANPDYNPMGLLFASPGMAVSGSPTLWRQFTEVVAAHKDPAALGLLRLEFVRSIGRARRDTSAQVEPLDHFLARVGTRVEELGRRYLPLIALRGGRRV